MNYTDTQLKQALAKMSPGIVLCRVNGFESDAYHRDGLFWRGEYDDKHLLRQILDTELLHLCWLVEETFGEKEINSYIAALKETGFHWFPHIQWQQRTIALAKVNGIEIV